MSRLPKVEEEEAEEDGEKENEFLICQSNVEVSPVNLEDDSLKNRQLTDPDAQWIHDLLKTSGEQIPTVTETLNPIQSALMRDYDNLYVRGRYVWQKEQGNTRLLLATDAVSEIIKIIHNSPFSGHLGRHKTWTKLRERFYHPFLKKETEKFVSECDMCQKVKPSKVMIAPIEPITRAQGPGQLVTMDIAGPLPETVTGNKYILSIICHFSKFVVCFAMRDQLVKTVAACLVEYICRYGVPKEILTDQGTNFQSNFMAELYDLLDIVKLRTSPFRPQTNGVVERFNQTLKKMLAIYVNKDQNDWDQHLSKLAFAYNTAEHKTTKFTPFELIFLRKPKLPIDLFINEHELVEVELELTPGEYASSAKAKLCEIYEIVRKNRDITVTKLKIDHERKIRSAKVQVGECVLILDEGSKPGINKKLTPR